jgi:hypothetical protein
MLVQQQRLRWVYLLPILHFCACCTGMLGLIFPGLQHLGIIWGFIMLFDLPISIVAYALAFHYSLLAGAWILTVGTLWWYLLSRGAAVLFKVFKDL